MSLFDGYGKNNPDNGVEPREHLFDNLADLFDHPDGSDEKSEDDEDAMDVQYRKRNLTCYCEIIRLILFVKRLERGDKMTGSMLTLYNTIPCARIPESKPSN